MTRSAVAGAALGLSLLLLRLLEQPGTGAQIPEETEVADLVVVTEDRAELAPGCDAVSVFSLDAGDALYRGPTHVSPGRLAAARDLALLLATWNNGIPRDRSIYALQRTGSDHSSYVHGAIDCPSHATLSGIAITPDGEALLVATAAIDSEDPLNRNNPPFWVRKYALPESIAGSTSVGGELGKLQTDGVAVEIVVGADAATAHVVTEQSWVYSIDIASMRPVAPRIKVQPFLGVREPSLDSTIPYQHATIS